jgi:hypothetical protein
MVDPWHVLARKLHVDHRTDTLNDFAISHLVSLFAAGPIGSLALTKLIK